MVYVFSLTLPRWQRQLLETVINTSKLVWGYSFYLDIIIVVVKRIQFVFGKPSTFIWSLYLPSNSFQKWNRHYRILFSGMHDNLTPPVLIKPLYLSRLALPGDNMPYMAQFHGLVFMEQRPRDFKKGKITPQHLYRTVTTSIILLKIKQNKRR